MPSISKSYSFDAAHHLPQLAGQVPEHKCSRLHGHTYRVKVQVTGPIDYSTGMILDYAELDKVVKPLIEAFDHRDLNTVIPSGPTAERLAMFLHQEVLLGLQAIGFLVASYGDKSPAECLSITVCETPNTEAVYP